jgi:hypothetical protein
MPSVIDFLQINYLNYGYDMLIFFFNFRLINNVSKDWYANLIFKKNYNFLHAGRNIKDKLLW